MNQVEAFDEVLKQFSAAFNAESNRKHAKWVAGRGIRVGDKVYLGRNEYQIESIDCRGEEKTRRDHGEDSRGNVRDIGLRRICDGAKVYRSAQEVREAWL